MHNILSNIFFSKIFSLIKKLFQTKLITVFALFILSITANAGEKIDKTLDAVSNGEVEIHNNRGIIVVQGWDKEQVSVKGELDDLAEKYGAEPDTRPRLFIGFKERP